MASLRGKLEVTVLDTAGNAKSGASVKIYLQGASVNGNQSGTTPMTVNVDQAGAIYGGDSVTINTGSTSYNVDSVTGTSVVLSGFVGPLSLNDDDRIVLAVPNTLGLSLYNNPIAAEGLTNPLTTDSNGYASCFVDGGFYDYIVSGTGLTTTLYTDYSVTAPRYVTSIADAAGNPAYTFDTNRTASSSPLLHLRNNGTSKMIVTSAGAVTFSSALTVSANGASITGGLTVVTGAFSVASGSTSLSGTTSVIGTLSASGVITASVGLTVTSGGITANGNSTIVGTLTSLTGITSSGTASFAILKHSSAMFITGRETIASANTISVAATTTEVELTGTTQVNTINLAGGAPGAGDDGRVLVVRDVQGSGSIILSASGNIYSAKTIADGDSVIMCWNQARSKWTWIARM